MGDYNAKIGQGEVARNVGHHGLGERNGGLPSPVLVKSNDMIISNTFFKLPNRRIYTWKLPADIQDRIVRNQIDFILILRKVRNAITLTKTYPGANIGSDHNPVVAKRNIKLNKIQSRHRKTINLR